MPNQRPDLLQSAGHLLGYLNPFQGIESSIRHEIALGIDGTAGSQSLKYPEIWRSLKNPGYRPPARLIDGAQASLSQSAAGGDDPAIGLLAAQHLHQTAADPTTHGWRKAALLAGAGMEAIPSLIPAEAGIALRRPSGVNPAHGPYAPYGGIDAFDAAYQSPTRGSVESGRIQADYGTAPGSTLPRGVWDPAWGPQPTLRPGQQPDLSARPIFDALAEARAAAAADATLAAANQYARARRAWDARPNPIPMRPGPPRPASNPPELPPLQDHEYFTAGYHGSHYAEPADVSPGSLTPWSNDAQRVRVAVANRERALAAVRAAALADGYQPNGSLSKLPPVQPTLDAAQTAAFEAPAPSPFQPRPEDHAPFVRLAPSPEARPDHATLPTAERAKRDAMRAEQRRQLAQIEALFPGMGGHEPGHPIDDVGAITHRQQPFGRPVALPPTEGKFATGVAVDTPHSTGPEGGDGPRPLAEWEQGMDRYRTFIERNQSHRDWPALWRQAEADAAAHDAGEPAPPAIKQRQQIASQLRQLDGLIKQYRAKLITAQYAAITDPSGRHASGIFNQETVDNQQLEADMGDQLSAAYDAQMFLTKQYARIAGFRTQFKDPVGEKPAPSDARTAGFHDAGYASGRPTIREQQQAIGPVRFDAGPKVWGQESQNDNDAKVRNAGGVPRTAILGQGRSTDIPGAPGTKPTTVDETTPPSFSAPDANGASFFDPRIPANTAAVAHLAGYSDGQSVPGRYAAPIIEAVAKQVGARRSATLTALQHQLALNRRGGRQPVTMYGAIERENPSWNTRDGGSARLVDPTRQSSGLTNYKDLGADLVRIYRESGLAKTQEQAERMAVSAMLSGPGYKAVKIGNTAAHTGTPNTKALPELMRQRTRIADAGQVARIRSIATPLHKWTVNNRPLVVSFDYAKDRQPDPSDLAPVLQPYINNGTAHTKTIRFVTSYDNAATRWCRAEGFNVELIPPGPAVGEASRGADVIFDPRERHFVGNAKWLRGTGNRYIGLITPGGRSSFQPTVEPKPAPAKAPEITYGKTRQQRK